MQIIFQTQDKTLIVKIIGELDHHVVREIKDRIDKKITNTKAKNLIFDFSSLSFMDSSGIGLIVGRYKVITSIGGKMLIVSNTKTIDRIINLAGIKKIIDTKTTIDEALKCTREE